MCGIVGYTGMQQAAPILLEGLKRLEYRGYDSAGIAIMDDGSISVQKVSGRIAKLCELTEDGNTCPGNVGIGHTRWATHGAPTDINAHPHGNQNNSVAVVHNGIIENYQEIREWLQREYGVAFKSETDSEVIAHLIGIYYDGDLLKAVNKHKQILRLTKNQLIEDPDLITSTELR